VSTPALLSADAEQKSVKIMWIPEKKSKAQGCKLERVKHIEG
jgi:hypothetical protein